MALRPQRDEVTKEPKISGQWSVVGGQWSVASVDPSEESALLWGVRTVNE